MTMQQEQLVYYAGTTEPKSRDPRRRFVTVRVTMPHVAKYQRATTMELTYGCTFEVAVGDRVRCPPTRLNREWVTGTVIALDSTGYTGPVKYLAQHWARRTR